MILLASRLHGVWLWPRRYAEQQHFTQRPDVIRQASGYRGRPRPVVRENCDAITRRASSQGHIQDADHPESDGRWRVEATYHLMRMRSMADHIGLGQSGDKRGINDTLIAREQGPPEHLCRR